jgi:hypothetical protein
MHIDCSGSSSDEWARNEDVRFMTKPVCGPGGGASTPRMVETADGRGSGLQT